MTLTHWSNFTNGVRVIGSTRTPNPRYHGRRGYVVRVMQDLQTSDFLVEVRWDTHDEPVDGLYLQVMSLNHLEVDQDWLPENKKPYLIHEQPAEWQPGS